MKLEQTVRIKRAPYQHVFKDIKEFPRYFDRSSSESARRCLPAALLFNYMLSEYCYLS